MDLLYARMSNKSHDKYVGNSMALKEKTTLGLELGLGLALG